MITSPVVGGDHKVGFVAHTIRYGHKIDEDERPRAVLRVIAVVDRRGRRYGDEGGLEGGATTDGKENEGRQHRKDERSHEPRPRLIGPASILGRTNHKSPSIRPFI